MQWRSIGHGMGGYPQAVEAAPSNPGRIYLGIDVGLPYRSDDRGATWQCIGFPLADESHLAQRQIIRIAISHQDPDVAYFMTLAGGIWKTIDAGASYSRVGTVTKTGDYHWGHLIAISPVNHDHVILFADKAFAWTQNGKDLFPFPALNLTLAKPVATAVIPSADGTTATLFVGSSGKLWRYSGTTGQWTQCRMTGFPTGGFMATEMSARPLHNSIDWGTSRPVLFMLAGKNGKAYRSDNLGDNWQLVPNSPTLTNANLWVDPLDSRRMAVNQFRPYATLGFMTDSGGLTGWEPQIIPGQQSRRFDQNGGPEMHGYKYTADRDFVLGIEGYSLYGSNNGGRTFGVISQERLGVQHYRSSGCEATFANWVSVNEDGSVFVFDQDCGGARSDDDLASWHCLRYGVTEEAESDHPAGLAGQSIWNLDSPSGVIHDNGDMIVWITGRTVMQSELERFEYIWGPDVWGAAAPKDRHGVYLSRGGERFHFHGRYAGFPWQWNALSNALDMDRSSNPLARTMYLAVPAGIFRSTDGGRNWGDLTQRIANVPAIDNRWNWNRQPNLFAHVRVDPFDSRRIWATTVRRVDPPVASPPLSAIFRSENEAATWQAFSSPISSCWAFEFSPLVPGLIFAADRDSGLYRSQDGGKTWDLVLILPWITSIIPSRHDPATIYVAADAEYKWFPQSVVRRSTNGGHTWEDITGDLPHWRVMSLVEDPRNAGRIYIGTRGAGAFLLDLTA